MHVEALLIENRRNSAKLVAIASFFCITKRIIRIRDVSAPQRATLKREATVVIFAASDNRSVLLASNEVQAEDSKRNRSKDDTKRTVVDTEREAGTVTVESIIHLQEKCQVKSTYWIDHVR